MIVRVEGGRVLQAFQFALDPTPVQDAELRSHCGAQRFAYNWGLALITANLAQRAAERSYGIPTDRLTPQMHWSAYSLRKHRNQAKDQAAPWWPDNSKEAYSSGLANLATALTNWQDSRTGRRRGPTVRFPRFKGKRAGMSCRFTTGAFGMADIDRRHVKLPRIGLVRTHESTRTPRAACRAGHLPRPVRHRDASRRPVVRVILRRDHPRRPADHAASASGGRGPGR